MSRPLPLLEKGGRGELAENGGGAGGAAGAQAWQRPAAGGVGPPLGRALGVLGEGFGVGEKEEQAPSVAGLGPGRGKALACASRDLRLMYGLWGWKAAILAQ